jgi:octaprenyl-diphosphate synthase
VSSTLPTRPGGSVQLADIQAPVRDQLRQVADELWRLVADDVPLVLEVNHRLMMMKGKMLRPTLVLLAGGVDAVPGARAVTLAAAVELIHLASLVHDDSVDHSVLRRGMPTVNSVFSHQVSVIMGDFLYARALRELVQRDEFDALRVITEASNDMTRGEILQLAVFDALSFSEADYYALIKAKTASLFSASCQIGAIAGSTGHRVALGRYGERLGMAFQVADDLLDYTGAKETTGKPTGLDLREHKVTLPLIAALRTMSRPARERVDRLFATPEPTDTEIAEVVGIVGEAGGLDYARRKGDEFAQEAEEALTTIPDGVVRSALADAIAYAMDRRL